MLLYLLVIKNNALLFFQYRIEMISHVLKKLITPLFFILLWYTISQTSNFEINFREIVSYYLVATGINEILMARWGEFSRTLGKYMIKNGNLNNLLIKPVHPVFYSFSIAVGKNFIGYVLSILIIIIGLVINPPTSVFSIFSGLLFIILGFIVSFAFNLFEATIFIYVPDGDGFRSTINHIKSLLGGLFIPLSYFPQNLKVIVEALPFASMIYLPTTAFRFTEVNDEFIKYLVFTIIWGISLNILAFNFWKFSLKKYDAIGI